MMEKKYKIGAAVAAGAVLITALAGFAMPGGSGGGPGGGAGDAEGALRTVTLEKTDMVSSVSATGTVYSSDSTGVYSNLSYPVRTVYVKQGDVVSEGDVLAELDSSDLQSDIAQKSASVSNSQATAQQNLKTAQQDLETYQKNLENNYETNLINAKSSLDTAEIEYNTAKLDLESAQHDLRSARRKYDDERTNYYSSYSEYEGDYNASTTESSLNDLREQVTAKQITVDKAEASLEKAEANLEKARISYDAALNSAEDSITTYQDKVESAQLNTDFSDQWISIQKLQSDLEKCTVTAPVSGTITAVQAVEGASSSGLLFVIQDTDDLKILTNIKEYDIASVQVGDRVIIKSDATGEREYAGTLSKIAATSTLTTTGETTSSTDAEYEAEITVDSGADGLLIGMNTRLSIVTEEKRDVFSVPYEAVKKDGMGQSWIFALAEDGEATTAIPVVTGLETNLYIEVAGDGLTEGMEIVKNAQNLDAGAGTAGEMPAGMELPDDFDGDADNLGSLDMEGMGSND